MKIMRYFPTKVKNSDKRQRDKSEISTGEISPVQSAKRRVIFKNEADDRVTCQLNVNRDSRARSQPGGQKVKPEPLAGQTGTDHHFYFGGGQANI